MKFRLLFQGEIRPRQVAKLEDVHAIRQQLHPQIKRLWDHEPLLHLQETQLRPKNSEEAKKYPYARVEQVHEKKYAPLVATDLAAGLDIIFLRQQAPGQLIGAGGDIDNRLKTLFDALRMPSTAEVQQLTQVGATSSDEEPLHCLLKDDDLIHSVSVETDRLLTNGKPRDLVAIIQVTVIATRQTWGTMDLHG